MIQTKGFFLIGGNSQRVCRKSPKSNIDFIILNFGGYRTIFVRVGYSLYSIWVSSLPIVLLFSAYVPIFSFSYANPSPYLCTFRRLCTMQYISHCVFTFRFPRRLNRSRRNIDRIWAKGGSAVPSLLL